MCGQTQSKPVTLLQIPSTAAAQASAVPDPSSAILEKLGHLPESRLDRNIKALTAATEPPADDPSGNFVLPKKYRGHSKYDVSKIGERSVGKGVNFYSLDKEQALGRELATQVEMESKLLKDPKITEYVNRLGQNLARNSDAKVPFVIKVIDSDEVNAFALPGGYFYVNTGLIEAADNEAELAGVMAHEIAHVAARHATKNMTKGQIWNIASIPLIFVGGPVGFAVQEAAGLAVPMSFLKFTRDAEREADLLGMEYQYAAGYDPESFVAFFEKLKAQEKHKKNFIAKAFDTHPMTEDRVKRAQKEIEEVLPPKPQYIVDTSEFEAMKARLASILNEHRLAKQNASDRPTLRRAENRTDTNSQKKGSDDDDRPTLKRPKDQY